MAHRGTGLRGHALQLLRGTFYASESLAFLHLTTRDTLSSLIQPYQQGYKNFVVTLPKLIKEPSPSKENTGGIHKGDEPPQSNRKRCLQEKAP